MQDYLSSVYENLSEYYYTFTSLPAEHQAITGIGAVVTLMAARTIWSFLYPVRWVSALSLRTVANILQYKKSKPKIAKSPVNYSAIHDKKPETPAKYLIAGCIDVSSCENLRNTLIKHFKKIASKLSNDQLNDIIHLVDLYQIRGYPYVATIREQDNRLRKSAVDVFLDKYKKDSDFDHTQHPVTNVDIMQGHYDISDIESVNKTNEKYPIPNSKGIGND